MRYYSLYPQSFLSIKLRLKKKQIVLAKNWQKAVYEPNMANRPCSG